MREEEATRAHYTYKLGPLPAFRNPTLDGLLDPEQEHPFDGTYWHFVDIGTDASKIALEKLAIPALERAAPTLRLAGRLLPLAAHVARFVPILGVAGELIHVSKPAMRAAADWWNGRLSTHDAIRLAKIYTLYAATGAGGFFTIGAKEAISYAARQSGWMDERYVPHTVGQELQHAGITDWVEDHIVYPAHDALDDSGIPAALARFWKRSGAEAASAPATEALRQRVAKDAAEIHTLGSHLLHHLHVPHIDCPFCQMLDDLSPFSADLSSIHERAKPLGETPRQQADKLWQQLRHLLPPPPPKQRLSL